MNTNEQKYIDWKACEAFWSDVTESFVCPIQMDGYAFDVSHTERTTLEEAKSISEKIVRAVNSYEPMQARIQELENALGNLFSFAPDASDLNNDSGFAQAISEAQKVLQSSKQL